MIFRAIVVILWSDILYDKLKNTKFYWQRNIFTFFFVSGSYLVKNSIFALNNKNNQICQTLQQELKKSSLTN